MTSEILPLEQIAVRVETEEESRAVRERYFELGAPRWKENVTTRSSCYYAYNEGSCGELRYGNKNKWTTADGEGTEARFCFSASSFLRDYPAPGEPKYPYLKDWKPGERVSVGRDKILGTVMEPNATASRGNDETFWRVCAEAPNLVPVRFDAPVYAQACWLEERDSLTRLTDSGNGTEATSPQKALESWGQKTPEAKPEAIFKVIEKPPWTCSHCGKTYPGSTEGIEIRGGVINDYEVRPTCAICVLAALEFAGIIKRSRTQTRAEALEDLAKGSRWTHPRLPWFGDRR